MGVHCQCKYVLHFASNKMLQFFHVILSISKCTYKSEVILQDSRFSLDISVRYILNPKKYYSEREKKTELSRSQFPNHAKNLFQTDYREF